MGSGKTGTIIRAGQHPFAPTEEVLRAIAAQAALLLPATYTVEQCEVCVKMGTECGSEWFADVSPPGFRSTSFDAPDPKEAHVPAPVTPECLFIFLHEIGHVVCEHPSSVKFSDVMKGMGFRELQASAWARAFMEARGIAMPPDLWERANEHAVAATENWRLAMMSSI